MYKDFLNTLSNPGYAFSFIGQMMQYYEDQKQESLDISMGIEKNEEGLYGCPVKNIPFQFFIIHYIDNHYICKSEKLTSIYNTEGEFLFSGYTFENLSDELFVVHQYDKKTDRADQYGSIFKNGQKMSQNIFRTQSMTKFKDGFEFCIISKKFGDISRSVVINRDVATVFVCDSVCDYPHLYGNVLYFKNKLYNLFTDEIICEKDYHHKLETDEHIFVQSDKQVFKIDIKTCEFEVFGKAREVEEKVAPQPQPKEEKPLPEPKQRRNDQCKCGSEKKYKNCCGK